MAKRVKLAAALQRSVDHRLDIGPEAGSGVTQVVGVTGGGGDGQRGKGFGVVSRVLSSAIFGAGYYVSFGIVFGAMTVWHLLPVETALGRGCRAGGTAGCDAYARWRAGPSEMRVVPVTVGPG